MPFAGLGLHILLAIACAVHAVRSRQPLYWLFILFAFPLLGSLVYFLAIYLPNSRLERKALRAVSAATRAIDPTRDIRSARQAYDDAPTAQNQMRLAAALLEAGDAQEAARQYEARLKGPFAADPDIRIGAARALTECRHYADALVFLAALRSGRPEFQPEAVTLLTACCLAGTARHAEAHVEFESADTRFGTFEVKAEYAIWALATGDLAIAEQLDGDIEKITSRWNALSRELNAPVMRRYRAAREMAMKG